MAISRSGRSVTIRRRSRGGEGLAAGGGGGAAEGSTAAGATGGDADGSGGIGGFGGGGGGAVTGGSSDGGYGGQGGSGVGAGGGGGAALGGAVFVRDGGTLIISDGGSSNSYGITPGFTGTYGVTAGTTGGTGGATAGKAQGTLMFLQGSGAATTLDVSDGNTQTIGGDDAIAGAGTLIKDGDGTLVIAGLDVHFKGAATVAGGLLQVDGAIGKANTTVETGATLGGNGKVGVTKVDSGATLSPGAAGHFDEDEHVLLWPSSNRVLTVAVGDAVRPGSTSNAPYTHYSILRLVEDALGTGTLV